MVLVSICIPTYNRADILNEVLHSIVSDSDFDETVEVVISDNCSTDHTPEVAKRFEQDYPTIHYFRNEKNIVDLNFEKVLLLGSGEFLKLHNDYLKFSSGALGYMKSKIEENRLSKRPVFFTNGSVYTTRKAEIIECNSLDEFVQSLATYVTWISNFSAWKSDFYLLKERQKYFSFNLMQVDWTYQIVEKRGKATLYDRVLFEVVRDKLGVRSGYNWFKIQVENYYRIMTPYIEKGLISKETYYGDLKYALGHFKKEIFITLAFKYNPDFQFDSKGTLAILWKHFNKIPMFYGYMAVLPFKLIFNVLYKNPRCRYKARKSGRRS